MSESGRPGVEKLIPIGLMIAGVGLILQQADADYNVWLRLSLAAVGTVVAALSVVQIARLRRAGAYSRQGR